MGTTQHEGTFYTFAYLLNGAYNAIETSREFSTGSSYQRVSAILFSAFAIEAHLNHIGEHKIDSWKEKERWLSPDEKLKLVAEIIEFKLEMGRRPFQSFSDIFSFRNYFAHGQTESIDRTISDKGQRDTEGPRFDPEILNRLSDEYVSRLFGDTNDMMKGLHKAAGFDENLFGLIASGISITKID